MIISLQYFHYITYLNKAVSYQMVISCFYFSVFYYLPAIKNKIYVNQLDILIVFALLTDKGNQPTKQT